MTNAHTYESVCTSIYSAINLLDNLSLHVLSWLQPEGIQSRRTEVFVRDVGSDVVALPHTRTHEERRDVHVGLAEGAMTVAIASVVRRENNERVLHHTCLGQAIEDVANEAINVLQPSRGKSGGK